MANTSYYLALPVETHIYWHPPPPQAAGFPLTLAPCPVAPLMPLQEHTESSYSMLQSTVICAMAAVIINNLLPTLRGKTHFTTRLVRSVSSTNLLVIILTWLISTGGSTISADYFSKLLLTWFLTHLLDLPKRVYSAQQDERKASVSTYKIPSPESEHLLNLISKLIDKLIIFAVILASIMLFFGSILYMVIISTIMWVCNSPYYKGTLHLLKPFVTESKKKCLSVAQSFFG